MKPSTAAALATHLLKKEIEGGVVLSKGEVDEQVYLIGEGLSFQLGVVVEKLETLRKRRPEQNESS